MSKESLIALGNKKIELERELKEINKLASKILDAHDYTPEFKEMVRDVNRVLGAKVFAVY